MLLTLALSACFQPDMGEPVVLNLTSGLFGLQQEYDSYSVACYPESACVKADNFTTVTADGGVEVTTYTAQVDMVWTEGSEYTVVAGGWGTEVDPTTVDNADQAWTNGIRLFPWPVCEDDESAALCVDYNK